MPRKTRKTRRPAVERASAILKRRKRRVAAGSGGSANPRASLIPKAELAEEIATIVRYRHLTQTEAAKVVGDAPSQMSLLMAGKIDGFSIERLLRMLLRLGKDIELVFRPAPDNRAAKFRISHTSGKI